MLYLISKKKSYKIVRNFKCNKLYIHLEKNIQIKNPKQKKLTTKNSTYTNRYYKNSNLDVRLVKNREFNHSCKIKYMRSTLNIQ